MSTNYLLTLSCRHAQYFILAVVSNCDRQMIFAGACVDVEYRFLDYPRKVALRHCSAKFLRFFRCWAIRQKVIVLAVNFKIEISKLLAAAELEFQEPAIEFVIHFYGCYG